MAALVRAVRAAANIENAANPANCRNVANVATGGLPTIECLEGTNAACGEVLIRHMINVREAVASPVQWCRGEIPAWDGFQGKQHDWRDNLEFDA